MHRIAFLFPGQGCQFIGMGKTVYDEFNSIVEQTFKEANDALNIDLKKICFEGSLTELNKLENMFPAILTISIALFRIYMSEIGIKPVVLAGHSLGEYSALVCSGAMEFADAVRIVRQRGILANKACFGENGTMTIVEGISADIVNELCMKVSNSNEQVSISCYNSSEQVVISGYKDAVMKVEDLVIGLDAKITPMMMSAPFHNSLMIDVAKQLHGELNKYSYNHFKYPVIANVSGMPYKGAEAVIQNLYLQMIQPVLWKDTLDYIEEYNLDMIIEIGPQAILSNLIKTNKKDDRIYSFGQKDDRETIFSLLKRNKIKNKKVYFISLITKCLAAAVCTRNKNWNNDEYKKGVIEPYEKIQHMQNTLEKSEQEPTIEQMTQALEMLRLVFITKKLPLDDQLRRFRKIIVETGTADIFEDFLK